MDFNKENLLKVSEMITLVATEIRSAEYPGYRTPKDLETFSWKSAPSA